MKTDSAPQSGMTIVDRLAILYLALPVSLFFFTWFKPVFGIPFALAAISGLAYLLPAPWRPQPARTIVFAAVVALLWSALSGGGHFFYAGQALNWPIRDAALGDLVRLGLPVVYGFRDGTATILRAPLAYYVVPALLARPAGIQYAHFLLYLWTALGVLLFLLQVMAGEMRWKQLALISAVVILFSGMDLLSPPEMIADPASGKVWQAFFYQSTYNTNLLIGFPLHALPGWLTVALIYRCRDEAAFLRVAGWVGALTLLWAPLVSVGLLPFFVLLAWRHFRAGTWRSLLSLCNFIAAPLVAIPAALYLIAAAGSIGSAAPMPPSWLSFLPVYALFMAMEIGGLTCALLYAYRGAIDPSFFWIAVFFLLVLPWFHFGPNNDLVTRGSIPALTVIMFAVIEGWARPVNIAGRGAVVTLILVIGAVMPMARMIQVVTGPVWKADTDHSLYEVTGGSSPNYLADVEQDSLLSRMLDISPAPK